jgi:glycosyltransferase involved in cell wall biosynthesis
VILILGMHRSGTSALAGGVAALGAGFGERLMQAVPDQNAKGFWEDLDVVSTDDRVLLALGRTWDSIEPIAPDEWKQPELGRLADEALELLKQRLDEHRVWAVKDPRASRLLPFWQPLIERAGAVASYVIALRNPLSVARSLAARDGFAAEKSHLLWMGHMLAAMDDSAGATRVVVDYDRLLHAPARELERVARALRMPFDGEVRAGVAEYANSMVSFDLRHSAFEAGALRHDPRVPGIVADAFELLQGLAGESDEPAPDASAGEWAAIGRSFRGFRPVFRRLDACDQRDRAEPPAPLDGQAEVEADESAAEERPLVMHASLPVIDPPSVKISVVVPLYNHREFIGEAIASIFRQTVAPAEVIVVDDGSTDDSADVMRRLCERHPEIVFWSQPNQGAHQALNAAIHRATGEFIAILNSDDVYAPRRLESCAAAMMADAGTAAVATHVRFIGPDGEQITNAWYQQALTVLDQTGDLPLALANANLLVSTSNYFIRRSVFREVGYFSPLRYTHDLDFALRLLASGKALRLLPEALLDYRLHGRNTIAEDAARVDIERAAVMSSYLKHVWRNPGDRVELEERMARLAETLESQSLADLVEHFLAAAPEHHHDRPAQPHENDGDARLVRDHPDIDWLAVGGQSSALSGMVSARRAVLARRSTPPFWLRSFDALQRSKVWLEEQNRSLATALTQSESIVSEQTAWISALEEARIWHEQQHAALEEALRQRDAVVADQSAWISTLEEARIWHEQQHAALAETLRQRDAVVADQSAWISTLEEARIWHEQQHAALEEALRQRDAVVADQSAWISTLEEARKWHEQQNRDLHDALGQRDAQAAQDTARSTEQIRSLELRAGESDARLLAQEAWLSDLERSRAWRILRLLNLTPGARRPDH